MAPDIWDRMQWAYGGGLTLAENGQCVFSRDGDAAAALALEGWASPLSSQTQESDIAAACKAKDEMEAKLASTVKETEELQTFLRVAFEDLGVDVAVFAG